MTGAAAPIQRTWTHEVMGSVATLRFVLRRPGDDGFLESIAACFAELDEMDRLFSPFRPDSDISRIRRGGLTIAGAHPLVAVVADACARAEAATRGLFSAQRDGAFDPTGFVKGWAVERAARTRLAPLLGTDGCRAAALSVGGDMQLLTADGDDWTWRVGIADPAHPGTVLATLDVPQGAVATSGPAERGAHIIDPRTGLAADAGIASATVVSDSLTHADVWATAAVVAGFDDLTWMPDAGTRTGMVVAHDGRVRRWLGSTEVSVSAPSRDIPPA